ncbi:15591_t:CDS:2, partial [Cetraspora pellucida]
FKTTNNKNTHYYLIGTFDYEDAPKLPSYQTDEGQFYENGEDMHYGYSKLSPNELEPSPNFRDRTQRHLRKIEYSEEQVCALVSFQKSERHTPKVNSIKKMAQKILKNDNLSYVDINEEAYYIAYLDDETFTDITRFSQLSYLQRELHKNEASVEVIDATKDHDITEESNWFQKIRQEILMHKKLDPPNHFMPEAILERLQEYSISYHPTEQALANIITMLCMRSAEVTTLHIANGHITGYAKGRGIDKGEPRKFCSMEKDEKQACELLTWIQKAIANGTLQDLRISDIKAIGCESIHKNTKDSHIVTIPPMPKQENAEVKVEDIIDLYNY